MSTHYDYLTAIAEALEDLSGDEPSESDAYFEVGMSISDPGNTSLLCGDSYLGPVRWWEGQKIAAILNDLPTLIREVHTLRARTATHPEGV